MYFKRGNNKFLYIFLASVLILVLFQINTTNLQDLSYLNNDEQRVQHMRLNEYPPVKISLFGKTVWVPIAHWLEERKEMIIFYRLEENFFQAIDPNLYFFSNHPRERVGVNEFEKFLYPLLPFFFVGIYRYVKEKQYFLIGTMFFSVIVISIVGFVNALGPFLIFPYISLAIYLGLEHVYVRIQKWSIVNKVVAVSTFLLLYGLSFVQILTYATK